MNEKFNTNAKVEQLTKIAMEMCPPNGYTSFAGSIGGVVVKLLACRARGPGFDSPPPLLNFRDWISPASKSRYGWKNR